MCGRTGGGVRRKGQRRHRVASLSDDAKTAAKETRTIGRISSPGCHRGKLGEVTSPDNRKTKSVPALRGLRAFRSDRALVTKEFDQGVLCRLRDGEARSDTLERTAIEDAL